MRMPRFINKIIKDFLNIYEYEDDSPYYMSFSNQSNDHVLKLDPVTGKKKVSAAKVLKRIVIIFIIALVVFLFIRIMWWHG